MHVSRADVQHRDEQEIFKMLSTDPTDICQQVLRYSVLVASHQAGQEEAQSPAHFTAKPSPW